MSWKPTDIPKTSERLEWNLKLQFNYNLRYFIINQCHTTSKPLPRCILNYKCFVQFGFTNIFNSFGFYTIQFGSLFTFVSTINHINIINKYNTILQRVQFCYRMIVTSALCFVLLLSYTSASTKSKVNKPLTGCIWQVVIT